MINVLIPSMGNSLFFREAYFPKPMIDVLGKTMLEQVVENFKNLKDHHMIFVFSKKDCDEFHLDDSAKLLTDGEAEILILENETAGAVCTCLMAVDMVGGEDPLVIANCDQIIDADYNAVISGFEKERFDAGVITFESIHPRWSYIREKNGEVIEAAEKRPLSKNAIAGFYWYRHGQNFVEAAENVLLKEENLNGRYYISATLNELILKGERVGYHPIGEHAYHSFYSPEMIEDYENWVKGGRP